MIKSRHKLYKKLGNEKYEITSANSNIFHIPRTRKEKCELLYKLYIKELKTYESSKIINLKKEFVREILEKLAK